MTTLTLINSLPVVETLSLSSSQIIINENSANNTLSRMTVGNFTSEFLPTGELISNAGGTVVGVDLSTLFTLSSIGTDGNVTLGLVQLSAGELLGNPTSGTNSVIGAGLSEFFDSNFGSIEGGLVYRDASAWLFLAPGTAGQVLTTNAEAGPPAWESVGVPVVDVVGEAPISVASSAGTATVSLIGSLGIELTDGSTTVAGATILTFEGASTLSGSGGHGTISVGGGGGGSLEVVGGSDTVTSVTEIIFDGATVTGSTGTATVSVGGGGAVPAAGLVLSTGTAFTDAVVGSNLLLTSGTLSVVRTGFPVNYHAYVPGTQTAASQILLTVDVAPGEASTFGTNLTGSIVKLDSAATANTTLTCYQNGSSVATSVIPASSVTGTITSAGFTTATADVIQWTGPATPDSTAAGFRIAMHGASL